MATKIQLKRSSGAVLPSSLAYGELAHISGIGSFGGDDGFKDRIYKHRPHLRITRLKDVVDIGVDV